MTLGRHLHRALLLSAVLAISHLGCGGSEGVKKPSTTGIYTPSEKGEDQIRVTAVGPTSHRAPATAEQPEPAAAPVAPAAQPTAEPANATRTASADDEPADAEPAAEPAPAKPAKGKKSASKARKHHSHRSKKHHK